MSCDSVPCCRQLFSDCYPNGVDCRDFRVRSSAVRERLDDLAKTSRVLLADCKGHYVPYESGSESITPQFSELVNDHVLR